MIKDSILKLKNMCFYMRCRKCGENSTGELIVPFMNEFREQDELSKQAVDILVGQLPKRLFYLESGPVGFKMEAGLAFYNKNLVLKETNDFFNSVYQALEKCNYLIIGRELGSSDLICIQNKLPFPVYLVSHEDPERNTTFDVADYASIVGYFDMLATNPECTLVTNWRYYEDDFSQWYPVGIADS